MKYIVRAWWYTGITDYTTYKEFECLEEAKSCAVKAREKCKKERMEKYDVSIYATNLITE